MQRTALRRVLMQRCDDQVDEQAVKYFVGHGDNKFLTSDLAIILIDQVS